MSKLYIKTLKVLDPPSDAGGNLELKLQIKDGKNCNKTFTADVKKAAGAIWKVKQDVEFSETAFVSLSEEDSTSKDDNYGEVSISAKQQDNGDPIDFILDFGKENSCQFIVSYSVLE